MRTFGWLRGRCQVALFCLILAGFAGAACGPQVTTISKNNCTAVQSSSGTNIICPPDKSIAQVDACISALNDAPTGQ